MRQPAQSLDAALAHSGWLMPEVLFNRIMHRGADVGLEIAQVLDRFRSQYDVVCHSGYILARMVDIGNGSRVGEKKTGRQDDHSGSHEAPRGLQPSRSGQLLLAFLTGNVLLPLLVPADLEP